MAKIEKIKKGTETIYPATIPQAVVDPTSGKSARAELDEKANHGYESNPKTLKSVDDAKADHGYESDPKTLKAVDEAKVDKTSIVGETGQGETSVMHQKAVTDELGTKASHGYESNPKSLKEVDDEKAYHGYAVEETPKTLKEVDTLATQNAEDISQLAGDVSLLDAVQGAKIKDIENVLSTANIGQSAKISVTGTSPLSLPKNAANSGMSVKLEGLTQDVGGVITHFVPTGRVRSVDKNGLNPTALYLTAPELRSNGLVKDEIRKGVNGYELVKRVGHINADSLTWEYHSSWSTANYYSVRALTPDFTISDSVINYSLENYGGVYTTDSVAQQEYDGLTARWVTHLYIKVPKTDFTGVPTDATIKDWLSSRDIKLTANLATPEITPVSYGGILNSAENGTVYHEPVIADAGVYGTNMPILLTDYPISSIEEIIKHEGGVDTYLSASTAVIAPDGLSFTHPDLGSGDLVLFTYAFDKETTNGNITATFYDSNVVKIDTVTGKAYKITDVVTNGVLTRTLTEV